MDLSAVAELKVTDKGGVEIKMVDRVRALKALCGLLENCDGAVPSSKTFAMGLSFFLWAQARFDGRQFELCGKTIVSLRRNLLADLTPYLRRLGMDIRERRALRLHFTMEDNPALPERIRERCRRNYSGAFYRRFVLGEWSAAEGLVYNFFNPDRDAAEAPEDGFSAWRISAEYADDLERLAGGRDIQRDVRRYDGGFNIF